MNFLLANQIWGIASAIAVMVLGLASLSGGKARARGALAFSFFALLWGGQIALGNLSSLTPDPRLTALFFLLFVACAAPATFFLVEFAVSQVPKPRSWLWAFARTGVLATAVAVALCLVFAPGFLVQEIEGQTMMRGPLYTPLVVWPQFIAFGLSLFALFQAMRRAATPRLATASALLLAGLGIHVGFVGGYFTITYAAMAVVADFATAAPYLVIMVGMVAITGGIVFHLLGDARHLNAAERRRNVWTALALLVPLVWGVFEGFVAVATSPFLNSSGLWRIVGVGVIAYGLARWRIFDLPQRASRTAANATGATASIVTGFAAFGLAGLLTATTVIPIFLGLVAVGGTFLPALKFARRIFASRAEGAPGDDTLYGQRVETYRAALESALARGDPEEDHEFLSALRERFGISADEDRLLRHLARAAVILPTNGDTRAAYDRLRLLGEGGAGRTWLARDRVRDRLVVLKEPIGTWQREPALREGVLREARLAARVRHPNVIHVEEVIEDKGLPIIVMEYAEGGSLRDRLHARGVLPWRDAVEMTVGILRGVEAIHAGGILHRDLKPSNVLLDGAGAPKVADFGIAVPTSATQKTLVSGATTFSGTLSYVAPEVQLGAVGDRRSDVYACGAILHECLYGSPPGPATPVLADNNVPSALTAIVARAISPDPGRRPISARAFSDELSAVMRS